jgi:hypothetical protein
MHAFLQSRLHQQRWLAAWIFAALLLLRAPVLLAAESAPSSVPENPDVASAYVTVQDGVFLLNVNTRFPPAEDIRRALDDGVTLNFDLHALVQKRRRLWLNATLVDATLQRELSWHAVSERYVLKDLSLGGQQLFTTLDEALIAAGSVNNWPVVVESQLEPDGAYAISLRAGMRRGRMSDTMRRLLFWSSDWNRFSDWHELVLPR